MVAVCGVAQIDAITPVFRLEHTGVLEGPVLVEIAWLDIPLCVKVIP